MNTGDFSFIDQAGKVMVFYSPACYSTQDLVHACADVAGKHKPVALLTFDQRAGRGQFQRTWISQPGMNVALSLLWPILPGSDLNLMNKAVALACLDVVRNAGIAQAQIKWPNDIRSHAAKLCGILLEGQTGADYRKLCIGIGMNVNQTGFPDLDQPVSSLKTETGRDFNLMDVAMQLLRAVQLRFEKLSASAGALETAAAFQAALEGIGEVWQVAFPDGRTGEAVFNGTDDHGRAILDFEAEGRCFFHHGEIRLRKKT